MSSDSNSENNQKNEESSLPKCKLYYLIKTCLLSLSIYIYYFSIK